MQSSESPTQFSQDQQILAARQKRRVWVFVLSAAGALLLLGYLLWLFLAKGYQISVNPAEARSTMHIQLSEGTGFVFSNKVYTFSANTVVKVAALKYITQEVVINPESPGIIAVTLLPAPVELSFMLMPEVEGEWQVNGVLVASAKQLEHQLPPGDIVVNVSHPWFNSASWQGTGTAAEKIQQSLTLEPVTGQISIASQPSGAEVVLDGEPMGQTPLTLERNGGEYAVEVRLSGYQSIADDIVLENQNLSPTRNYLLVPEQGKLQFTLSPSNGLLAVNRAPVTSEQVSVDANVSHRITYDKPGFIAQSKTVTLKPGELRNLSFSLQKEMVPVELMSSLPAEVKIAGKSVGQTPLTLDLQTIEQEIQFVKPGFRTVRQTITPQVGKINSVFAEILSEFDARRKEGRPLFIAGLGIEMKKFRPRGYTMGSPENEPYRRRNEHRISVDFTRHIWVAKHETTEAQFATFRRAGVSSDNKTSASSDLPVTNVSWQDAAEFCYWLSVEEGLDPFYIFDNGDLVAINPDARGYRLLTEAEWEWLAKVANRRAPTQYTWGSQERIPKGYGNYADESVQAKGKFTFAKYNDGFKEKAPVGSFKADRTGLFDLDGNVAEWVHDKYTLLPPDSSAVYSNYLGMTRGTANVIKGGSYESGRYRDLRVARREEGSEASPVVGFRIARYDR